MDIRIGTGDRDIGGMGPGNPVTITTAGTAGKQSRPCEGGCRMSGIRWLTLLLLLLGLSGCLLTKVATVPMRVGGAVAWPTEWFGVRMSGPSPAVTPEQPP